MTDPIPSGDGCLADRELQKYTFDRVAEARSLRDRYLADGTYPGMQRRFKAANDAIIEHGDPFPEILAAIAADISGSLLETGVSSKNDLNKLRLVLTDDDSITATYRPYPDGSGLVIICDGLTSLAQILVGIVAERIARFTGSDGLHVTAAIRWVVQPEPLGEYDLAVFSSLLRYHYIQQMLHRNAGKLDLKPSAAAGVIVDVLNSSCLRFVVAHEMAHHILGHDQSPKGFASSERLESYSNEMEHEMQADDLALSLVMAKAKSSAIVDAFGALLAISAIHCAENAFFVRRGTTHPAAADRAGKVLERLPGMYRSAFESISREMDAVVNRSLDFTSFLPPEYWKAAYENPRVLTEPHSDKALRLAFEWDKHLCGPVEKAGVVLKYIDDTCSTRLADGLDKIEGRRVDEALAIWGVRPEDIPRLSDRSLALTFSELHYSIHRGLQGSGRLDRTAHLAASIACTKLAQQLLT